MSRRRRIDQFKYLYFVDIIALRGMQLPTYVAGYIAGDDAEDLEAICRAWQSCMVSGIEQDARMNGIELRVYSDIRCAEVKGLRRGERAKVRNMGKIRDWFESLSANEPSSAPLPETLRFYEIETKDFNPSSPDPRAQAVDSNLN